MKILKLGKREFTELVYKTTCQYCGCEFEFKNNETEEDVSTLYCKRVRCPCCSRKVECFVNDEQGYPREITIHRDFFGDGTFEDRVVGEQND